GTSIGAFNGSVIADTPGDEGVSRLVELWDSLSKADVFKGSLIDRIFNVARLQPAIHKTEELRLLLEHVHGVGRKIEDLKVPFQCVAASIEKAGEHWFTEGPLLEAVLASSAVPALFPPVEIDGEHFYDGGLVNSVPLDRAVELGAETIFVLQVGRLESPLRPPERLHESALIAFEIARRHMFARALRNMPTGVELHVLPSGNPVAFDDRRQIKWRDTGGTKELVDASYEATREYLGENLKW
ncbi:MAG: patatin-like phospholipase family protein, partial [Acidimicrobiia bacterium]